MSNHVAPDSTGAAEKPLGRPLPTLIAAVIYAAYAIAWLPALALFTFHVPKFERLFVRLREQQGELPIVTEWLLWFSTVNRMLFGLPCLLAFALLLFVDSIAARRARRSIGAQWLYWLWFAAVLLTGFLAVALILSALLLPVFTM